MNFKKKMRNESIYTQHAKFTIFNNFDILYTLYLLNNSWNNELFIKLMNLKKADIFNLFVFIIFTLNLISLIEKINKLNEL